MTDCDHTKTQVRLAVIEEKLDSLNTNLTKRFIKQDKVDERQDRQIQHLEETKADKEDIKELKAFFNEKFNLGIKIGLTLAAIVMSTLLGPDAAALLIKIMGA